MAAIAAAWLFAGPVCTEAADFFVEAANYYFTFNGSTNQNPVITLIRGATYTFEVQTPFDHPLYILPDTGVENNNIFEGTITFHVPVNAVNNAIQYFCTYHGFGNVFHFVDPGVPPSIQIVGLTVGTNLVLTSTGTNNWNTIPEYSTNLVTTNWYGLSVQTNRFDNGTNETICGRPPGDVLFFRIRATQQVP